MREPGRGRSVPALSRSVLLASVGMLLTPAVALGHGVLEPGQPLWTAWPWDPYVLLGLALGAWAYARGMRDAPRGHRSAPHGRDVAWFAGLLALFVALQTPLEVIADHLFAAHQVEHMLLRTGAPMLLVLAWPQARLMRGLPRGLRRALLRPVARSGAAHAVFRVLTHPAMVTAIFLGGHLFWMIPRYHDLALLDEGWHELWHATLLLSGLLFWGRVLDRRPRPLGLHHGLRLLMVWCAILGNLGLGAYLAFKAEVLYPAYDQLGRLWAIAPLADERQGGLIMWMVGVMMLLGGALLVVRFWAGDEEAAARRQALAQKRATGCA